MNKPARPLLPDPPPAAPVGRTTLPILHLLLGVGYALVSFTGWLCQLIIKVCFIVWVIAVVLAGSLGPPADALPLAQLSEPADVPTWFRLVFIWWLVSSVWMATRYKLPHDATQGCGAYIFGGGWAWRSRKRGQYDDVFGHPDFVRDDADDDDDDD